MSMTQTYQGALAGTNVRDELAARRQPATAAPKHPLVDAVLAVAANRTQIGDADWQRVLTGFGPAMDVIADDLETADEYEAGERDHEVRSNRSAEAETQRLRDNAGHTAALVASLIVAGA